jgi:hypothetical protein
MGEIVVHRGEWPVDRLIQVQDRNDLVAVITLLTLSAEAARQRSQAQATMPLLVATGLEPPTQTAGNQKPSVTLPDFEPTLIERLSVADHPLTAKEMASNAYFGCTPKTIYRQAIKGIMPSYKNGGRRYFNGPTVARWLAKQELGSDGAFHGGEKPPL